VELSAINRNSFQTARPIQDKSVKGKFSDALASVQSNAAKSKSTEEESVLISDTEELAKEIQIMANFLQQPNLPEEGKVHLEESAESLESILEQLGIDNSQLNTFLGKWINESNTPDAEEMLQLLSRVLSGMRDLSNSELANKLDQNDLQILKALKIYQLYAELPSRSVSGNSSETTIILKEIGSKMANVFEQEKLRTEYLQIRFTRLAADLNTANSKSFKTMDQIIEGESSFLPKSETNGAFMNFLPQLGKVEQLSLMLNSGEKNVSAEQLMKQFESILSKAQFMNSGGTQKLFIKLFPEHLGSVRVELFQKDQSMVARIITSTGTAKETLESHINGLKQAFASQNIPVERIEVSQQTQQQERFWNRDSQQHQRQQDNQEQHDKKEDNGEFSLSFEEALLNTEA
jgi:flagellar hook-length control protein FliK